jgi:diguanylate cyclase (GGDEF)-like protein
MSQAGDERRQLSGKIVGLAIIPIAAFCGVFLLARAGLGLEPRAQLWTWIAALACAVGVAFLIAGRLARMLSTDLRGMRTAVQALARAESDVGVPEVSMPLAGLRDDLAVLTEGVQGQLKRMQEKLDGARQQLFYVQTHDPLTGCANRKTLEERMETVIAIAKAEGNTHALLYIDLDFFQRINDSFGHLAGDEMLRQVAPYLTGVIRDQDLIARVGGDEFGVLLENCGPEFAQTMAARLVEAMRDWQFAWEGNIYTMTASIGVVAITRLTTGVSSLFTEADSACFTAKEQGRNRAFAFHDAGATQRVRQTSRGWLKRINDALGEGAFTLLYQPILPLTGHAPGSAPGRVEALLRMSESGGELVLPMSFIPTAERYDLMRTIDRWVIDHAFADYRRLARMRLQAAPVELSVNLSGHTLSAGDFEDFLKEKLVQYSVSPQCLFLEITETAAIANVERARHLIERLREHGVRFLLDDFGSGLSSFNYLKHFPVDGIKIDGLFVKGVAKNYLDYALVESITKIGHAMGLQTIAEYVETEEIAKKLITLNIPYGQGFWLAPPQRLEEIYTGLEQASGDPGSARPQGLL